MKNTWRPIPIEQFFSDDPETLEMWKVLKITEEKSVPFYADEPIARSNIADIKGIFRTTFSPRTNFRHLLVVANTIGVKSIPTDIKEAFRHVLSQIRQEPLPEPNVTQPNLIDTINPELRDSLNDFLSTQKRP